MMLRCCFCCICCVLAASFASSSAGELALELDDDQIILQLGTGSHGIGVLCQSEDLRSWIPVYSFNNSGFPEPARLPVDGPSRYYRVKSWDSELDSAMVWIPPGEFVMGSSSYEMERSADEGPQRWVKITRGFWMAAYETTVEQFAKLMGWDPSLVANDPLCPVDNVSFAEAEEFCRRLTEQERQINRLPPACRYRLPSEAEWEYACRAGTMTRYSYGDDPYGMDACSYAWQGWNAAGKTRPVGTLQSNPWGLYDMHGNLFEWCLDYYGSYPDGIRLMDDKNHIYRGGSWYCPLSALRSASRHPGTEIRSHMIGFRVVLGPEPDTVLPPLDIAPPTFELLWNEEATSVLVQGHSQVEEAVVRYNTTNFEPKRYHSDRPPLITYTGIVKMAAFRHNYNRSATVGVRIEQLPVPAAVIQGNHLHASSDAPDAQLEYALNETKWTAYTGPVPLYVPGSAQIRVRQNGFLTSPALSVSFEIQ
jgi:formylglycine-generating enzyme required for sulfatase activity